MPRFKNRLKQNIPKTLSWCRVGILVCGLIFGGQVFALSKVEVVSLVQSLRTQGCGSFSTPLTPFAVIPQLDRAATIMAAHPTDLDNEKISQILNSVAYYFESIQTIAVTNAMSSKNLHKVLRGQDCMTLMDPKLSDLGIFSSGDQIFILLATPIPTRIPALEPVEKMWQEMTDEVNRVRAKAQQCGATHYPAVAPIKINRQLISIAKIYVRDLAQYNYLAHEGRDGSTPSERITKGGYEWQSVAENLAGGPDSVTTVVEGWRKSPGHCANLMNASVTEMGIAYALNPASTYHIYWVQVFGHPMLGAKQTRQLPLAAD